MQHDDSRLILSYLFIFVGLSILLTSAIAGYSRAQTTAHQDTRIQININFGGTQTIENRGELNDLRK